MAPATVILAASLVACFVLEVLLAGGSRGLVLGRFSLSGDALARGDWWTLVTHMFIHGSLLHLIVNVLGLWFVGPEVEFLLGRAKYLVLYLVSGISGGLLQTAFAASDSELIGASGAVCGILLSFTTAYPDAPLQALLFFVLPVRMKAKTLGRGVIVVSFLCAVLRIFPRIGHLAHLGGALAGAALTKWWVPAIVPPRSRSGDRSALDDVLRRVMEEGIEGLSPAERRILEKLDRRRGDR
ncbi:MAG: rhomboid family intramembrane serine protease [Chthoniobacterales bacterium]|nr:rhomboid family intramembrane serine protease [Chthoniobacterales bacterium]